MVYTSSNTRATSKTLQMTSKPSSTNQDTATGKNRSHQPTNMQFHQRRNVSLTQDQHPVAQNSGSRQKPPPLHYYQYHRQQQQQQQSAAQRHYAHDGNGSRQLMSFPAKAPIDVDNNNRQSNGHGNSDSSIIDECSDNDDDHYNSNRSILNHHNCQPTDNIYMDALSEVRTENKTKNCDVRKRNDAQNLVCKSPDEQNIFPIVFRTKQKKNVHKLKSIISSGTSDVIC